ncbi:FMN hydrolase / 5-amino-6-(5-phospho-D-ribitylamino)uracil phosphatase [Marchantia polymorpha subsp. ruderalis]|uniref:FCP1 homology domain-containing protein n=2 Tax=Marchantia polymorpha TaxID=3197 RepID=A0AAF6AVA2_MARPO|nr:hypothetical protein MARPO_0002s0020 [Marchantia polymorpha]BBN00373.1 hypothetical protein Mp_1g28600 [Marchantia polymorpha subsp. ruderalis]|eukprot:PTQ49510.1 hypothetical protein MARPO_0002s0020 [Marchantia polymorpha]
MPSFINSPSLPVIKMQVACLNVSSIAARIPMPIRSNVSRLSNQPGVVQIRRPVILFDVMGTIVRDPFHDRMPAYFGFTFKELLAAKHPTAWIEFEKGLLSEEEFAASFFQDGREYDYEGLKQCMSSGYEYLDGMATLLQRLKGAGFEMHAFSNYPSWYTMIENKLKLSQYLPWTFVSCHSGLRKPDHQAYLDAAEHLGVQPSECIFVDDQPRNIEAAAKVGMLAIQFQNAETLEKELVACGCSLQPEVSFSSKVVCDQS